MMLPLCFTKGCSRGGGPKWFVAAGKQLSFPSQPRYCVSNILHINIFPCMFLLILWVFFFYSFILCGQTQISSKINWLIHLIISMLLWWRWDDLSMVWSHASEETCSHFTYFFNILEARCEAFCPTAETRFTIWVDQWDNDLKDSPNSPTE